MDNIYETLMKNAPIAYLVVSGGCEIDTMIVEDYNDQFVNYFGLKEDYIGKKLIDTVDAEVYGQLRDIIVCTEQQCNVEGIFVNRSYYYNIKGAGLGDGKVGIFFTERAGYLDNYKKTEKTKLHLLENIPGMVFRCSYDDHWTMEYVSDGCKELTGYEPSSLVGNREVSYNEIIAEEYRDGVRKLWKEALEDKTIIKAEYEITTKWGKRKWVYEQGQPVFDNQGRFLVLEGVIVDVTEQKIREEKINFLTYFDAMTGIYNRRYYNSQVDELNSIAFLPLSVIVGDINGLKLINDAFGHDFGDQLIVKTAELLKRSVRNTDVLSRTGGDEFVILLPNTNQEIAEMVIERIREESLKFNEDNKDSPIKISISLGYSTRTSLDEKLEEVIKLAEDQMYRNKLFDHKSTHNTIIRSIRNSLIRRGEESESNMSFIEEVALRMSQKLVLTEEMTEKLIKLVSINDIRKIAIDTELLNKKSTLTKAEKETLQKHPEIGYRIAMASVELSSVADYVLSHHERWDGKGYPDGLEKEQIPLLSRIISIMDAYDAMISHKPYRKSMEKEQALTELRLNSGTQFDPLLVDLFLETVAEMEATS